MFNKLQKTILNDILNYKDSNWITKTNGDHIIISDGFFAIKMPLCMCYIDFSKIKCRIADLERCFDIKKELKPALKTGNTKEKIDKKKKGQLIEFKFEDQYMYVDKRFLDLLEIDKNYYDFRAYGRYNPLVVMDGLENIVAVICPVKV